MTQKSLSKIDRHAAGIIALAIVAAALLATVLVVNVQPLREHR
jgi:hypothetical protein